MAKFDDITIEVNAKLSIDEHTANGCLKLVELYVNQTGRHVLCHRNEFGEEIFEFEGATKCDTTTN